MQMLDEANTTVMNKIDFSNCFKSLWLTNKLDGSEDFLVTDKIMELVGRELIVYRESLMKKESPKTLKQLLAKITPPKGVCRKELGNRPWDEGIELFDCEGEKASCL